MNNPFHYHIYSNTEKLPTEWDNLAINNVFLTKKYLEVLDVSKPKNMECQYIGIFENQTLIGIAIAQYLDLNQIESFQSDKSCFKSKIKKLLFKYFSSKVLFVGNNMLTGQNAFIFKETVDKKMALQTLKLASKELKSNYKSKGKNIHIITFKDFNTEELPNFSISEFQEDYQFSTQPNMIFSVNPIWNNEVDYINALSKKYRDQYKRARKKMVGIEKRKLDNTEIIKLEDKIYELYLHVAQNAPFNTFFLEKNHFSVFKKQLKHDFLFYGYFLNNQLIGFNTLIKNKGIMETYFLGYDETIQREKMLYLNMLYDMIAYSINKGYNSIIFARTALEIKSSVGAKPIEMYGYMQHQNKIINSQMKWLFNYFEPKTIWKQRNPFK
ncbi:MAG TPA: hypothetical protein VN192_02760 [Flavobacterium sp.]|nr:hypothetical protein [Flavobacterium sp.]